MGVPLCANCDTGLDGMEPHTVECFEQIGELLCAECWEEMQEANEAEDHAPSL